MSDKESEDRRQKTEDRRRKTEWRSPPDFCLLSSDFLLYDIAQIDLVIDRRDKAINLCEIKFYSGEFTIEKAYSLTLRNKAAAFKAATKTRKSIVPTMITSFGIKRNMYSGNIQQEVTLDDLFC